MPNMIKGNDMHNISCLMKLTAFDYRNLVIHRNNLKSYDDLELLDQLAHSLQLRLIELEILLSHLGE